MALRTLVRYAAAMRLPDPLTLEGLSQARRSIAMLTTGQPSGLSREDALRLIAEVERLQELVRQLA